MNQSDRDVSCLISIINFIVLTVMIAMILDSVIS